MADVTKTDLYHLQQTLSVQILNGFTAITDRLDELNGRTRASERAIAVLQAEHDTEPEEKPLTRRDLKIVVGAISGAVTVCGVLLKFGGPIFQAAAAVVKP
jgi:hypothetical protein